MLEELRIAPSDTSLLSLPKASLNDDSFAEVVTRGHSHMKSKSLSMNGFPRGLRQSQQFKIIKHVPTFLRSMYSPTLEPLA